MIFSDIYRNPRSPLSKLRSPSPQLPAHLTNTVPGWGTDEYADLLSRDKVKQKDAVRKYLADKIRADWSFTWPKPDSASRKRTSRPTRESNGARLSVGHSNAVRDTRTNGGEATELDLDQSDDNHGHIDDDNDDAESIYSVVSENALHYRPRTEWTSDFSDDDDDIPTRSSPLCFDGSDNVQVTAYDALQTKKAKRRRALRDEMTWNDGLACFEARRNAWTGARTVRVRGKPSSSLSASPRSPRRFFFRRSISASPPDSALATLSQRQDSMTAVSDASSFSKDVDANLRKHDSVASSTSASIHSQLHPVETLLPIGQPLLPPHNPLRASIVPTVYLSLYDKVVLHGMQPACPVNLSDMLRSCVAGWKRDGEWPPRSSACEPLPVTRKKKRTSSTAIDQGGSMARRMSFGILGRDHCDESNAGKGIRRSLQRALGIGAMEG